MRTLILGEIVAHTGIECIKKALNEIKTREGIDLTIANAEGATGGWGCGKLHAIGLMKSGIDVLTGGEKLFYKPDMLDFIKETSKVLRPYNYPLSTVPGKGIKYHKINDTELAIVNILGTTNMKVTLNNPFAAMDFILSKMPEKTKTIIVIFHSSATAEKLNMLYHLDGRVSAVIGTHTKVLSADSRVTDKKTAYISDNGRCGSFLSIGGFDTEAEIQKLRTGMAIRSKNAEEEPEIQGVIVETGEDGKAVQIKVVKERVSLH